MTDERTLQIVDRINRKIVTDPVVLGAPGWGKVKPVYTIVDEDPSHEFLSALRAVNAEADRSILALCTGPPGSGKSRFFGRLLCTLDPNYLQSLRKHPVYTRDRTTAYKCHISVTLLPFLRAVTDELLCVQAGHRGDLPPGSWWHIDEPTDALSIEWWKKTAKILGKFLARNSYLKINVAICCQVKGRVLSMIRDLSNAWVRMYRPGHCGVHKMESRINYKAATRPEIVKPRGLWKVDDETPPPEEWENLYGPIKDAHAIQGALEDILTLEESGTELDPEMQEWLKGVKLKLGYVQ